MLAPAVLSVAVSLSGSMVGPERGSSYPIPPVSLVDHLHEAEFFGLVEVIAIDDEEPESDEESAKFYIPDQRVTLRVLEDWKGEREGELIVTKEHLSMICPAPPDYDLGGKRVAFLNRLSDGSYTTNGLSYGTKDAASALSYRRACQAWWKIQASFESEQAEERCLAEFEWLMAGLEDEHLRADMLRVLYPESASPKPRFPRKSYRECVANVSPERMKRIAQSVRLVDGWQAGMFCGFWALVDAEGMVSWLAEEVRQLKVDDQFEDDSALRYFFYSFENSILRPDDRASLDRAWTRWVESIYRVVHKGADPETEERRRARLLQKLDAELFKPNDTEEE